MPSNIANQTPENRLLNKIRKLEKDLKALKTNQLGVVVIPILTADPSSLMDGQVWYRSDTHVFKKRQNGVTKNWETA